MHSRLGVGAVRTLCRAAGGEDRQGLRGRFQRQAGKDSISGDFHKSADLLSSFVVSGLLL